MFNNQELLQLIIISCVLETFMFDVVRRNWMLVTLTGNKGVNLSLYSSQKLVGKVKPVYEPSGPLDQHSNPVSVA